jgi:ABC-type amino acid transport substrate-binding protein
MRKLASMCTGPCSRRAMLGLGAWPLLASWPLVAGAAKTTLAFSGPFDGNDSRYEYPRQLLQLALRNAGSALNVVQIGGMTQARLAMEVAEGRMDVLVLPMSWPNNQAVMPVRVPLRRGLLGIRLLLATPERAKALARCRTLEDLRTGFVMGYGADWVDRPAFTALGFKVVSGSSYSGLFDMLRAGRFDYLSRSAGELWSEIDHPVLGQGLVVVPRLALRYPLDDYFWVRQGNDELHDVLARGLSAARANGSLGALFETFYAPALRRAMLGQRQVFELGGYPVEPGTPLELFDVVSSDKRRGGRT